MLVPQETAKLLTHELNAAWTKIEASGSRQIDPIVSGDAVRTASGRRRRRRRPGGCSPAAGRKRPATSESDSRLTASEGLAPPPSIRRTSDRASTRWIRASSAWAWVRAFERSSGGARRTRSPTRVSIPLDVFTHQHQLVGDGGQQSGVVGRGAHAQNSSSAPVSTGGATGMGRGATVSVTARCRARPLTGQ